LRNPRKPEPNTFDLWPQKTPRGFEQLGFVFDPEAQTRRELGAEQQNNAEGKKSLSVKICAVLWLKSF
jgi:hypothetical protein